MALAVMGWSPVTIITRIPPVLHFSTASLTPSLGGSIRLTNPAKVRSSVGKLGVGDLENWNWRKGGWGGWG